MSATAGSGCERGGGCRKGAWLYGRHQQWRGEYLVLRHGRRAAATRAVRNGIEDGIARRRLGALCDDSARLGFGDGARAPHLSQGAGGGGEQSGRGPGRAEDGRFVTITILVPVRTLGCHTRNTGHAPGATEILRAGRRCGIDGGPYTLTGANRSSRWRRV